jgi:outer membrane protein assembly factor BamA
MARSAWPRVGLCGSGPSIVLGLSLLVSPAFASPQPPEQPVVKIIAFEGVTVFRAAELRDELHLEEGRPLPAQPDDLARNLEEIYRRAEYSYVTARAEFDPAASALTFRVDEGRIDEIRFEGLPPHLERQFEEQFDVRRGDVFNRNHVDKAVERLLESTRGAVEPQETAAPAGIVRPDPDWPSRSPVHLVGDPGSKRTLVVSLRTRAGKVDVDWGTNGREDWFSPVDGFAPAIGFNAAVFDSSGFNHTFLTGFFSYKIAREEPGYALGIERPFFRGPRVFLGAEVYDLTGSDDFWRLSQDEQSLVALGFKNTFRDYYRRRGVQAHAAIAITPHHEALVAFRREHHDALDNSTDFSFFRDSETYRENALVDSGLLKALMLGYTFDSRGLDRDPFGHTYRRHQLDDGFGSSGGGKPGFRVEWTSEIAEPDTFGGDFDFRRHILNARVYTHPTPHQFLNARFIAGLAEGTVPQQRVFALGGLGTVRGYSFKEEQGERMALFNVEYKATLGDRWIKGVGFFDAGRVGRPLAGSTGEWLQGVGVGLELGTFRLDFGWRLDDIPQSLQVTVRFSPLF